MRVGPYELQGRLGNGAAGTVHLGWRQDLDLRVAVKQLAPELAAMPAFLARFRSEAVVMATLDDPNCVRVVDLIETADGVFLVTEYIDGQSLETLLAGQRKLSPEQLVGAVRGALHGLGHAHELGLIHRNVKPSNILCDRNGMSKLGDFGQVVDVATAQRLHSTPAYMSPELVTDGAVDRRSDIYSVGAVLYEALEGRPPFVAGDPFEVLRMHVLTEVPEPRQTPAPLRFLLLRALAKDPRERPSDVAEMMSELEAGAGSAYGPDWPVRAAFVLGGATAGAAAGALVTATASGPGVAVLGATQTAAPGATAAAAPAPAPAPAPALAPAPARSLGVRRAIGPAVAAILLAGALAVARSGDNAGAGGPGGTGVRFQGQGTAASAGTAQPPDCALANLSFAFTASGDPGAVARTIGQTLTVQLTANRSDVVLVGTIAGNAVTPDGTARFAFPAVRVPQGGAAWTARAVRLGATTVDSTSRPVTVGVTCAAS